MFDFLFPGKTQPPPRVTVSLSLCFPPALQVPEMRAHPWESRGHRDRATVVCRVIMKRRRAMDIHHGRLGKLRKAERAEMGRGSLFPWGGWGAKRKGELCGHQREMRFMEQR